MKQYVLERYYAELEEELINQETDDIEVNNTVNNVVQDDLLDW